MKLEDIFAWFEEEPELWKAYVLRERLAYFRALMKRKMLLCPVCGSYIKAVEYNNTGALWCDSCAKWLDSESAVIVAGEPNNQGYRGEKENSILQKILRE